MTHDIALIELQGCLDPLQNIKLEIGELCENYAIYFYALDSGCFVKNSCRIIKKTNLDMKKKMSANEFVIEGKEGDSGTPIFSRSGTCVGSLPITLDSFNSGLSAVYFVYLYVKAHDNLYWLENKLLTH